MTQANREKARAYYQANREKARLYRLANADKRRAYDAAWRRANPDKTKAYHQANRDKRLASTAAWQKANRRKVNVQKATRYRANRDKKLAQQAAWRKANRDKSRAAAAAWQKANPGKRRAHDAKRRALKLSQLCTCCTEEQIRDEFFPSWIGTGFDVDHRVPLAIGGLHCRFNLQLLSKAEHIRKTSADAWRIAEFRRSVRTMSNQIH